MWAIAAALLLWVLFNDARAEVSCFSRPEWGGVSNRIIEPGEPCGPPKLSTTEKVLNWFKPAPVPTTSPSIVRDINADYHIYPGLGMLSCFKGVPCSWD